MPSSCSFHVCHTVVTGRAVILLLGRQLSQLIASRATIHETDKSQYWEQWRTFGPTDAVSDAYQFVHSLLTFCSVYVLSTLWKKTLHMTVVSGLTLQCALYQSAIISCGFNALTLLAGWQDGFFPVIAAAVSKGFARTIPSSWRIWSAKPKQDQIVINSFLCVLRPRLYVTSQDRHTSCLSVPLSI